MMRCTRSVGLMIALLGTPALAHDFWIEPATFAPREGALLAARLRVGVTFPGDAVPRRTDRIVDFSIYDERGKKAPLVALDGADPAGLVRVPEGNSFIIGYRSTPIGITLEAEEFTNYLREEGLDQVIAARAQRGEEQQPGREVYSRAAKALLHAPTATGERVPLRDLRLGYTLELVADDWPAPSAPREQAFTLYHQGSPLPGALVVAISASDPSRRQSRRTDHAGRAVFSLDRPGTWLVKAVHMVPAVGHPSADWESLWASLTLDWPDQGTSSTGGPTK